MQFKKIIESDSNQIRRNTNRPKGWCKVIDRLNNAKKNGYGIIGDWINPNSKIHNGKVYLDASPISKNSNKMRYTVFTVINGEYKELAHTDKQTKWARELWDDIADALKSSNGIMPSYIYSLLKADGIDDESIYKFAKAFEQSIFKRELILECIDKVGDSK